MHHDFLGPYILGMAWRFALVIHRALADAHQLRLTGERQVMAAVNHRLSLSNPALLRAPCKKSFSKVSCPILAYSSLRFITGAVGASAGPNTSAARVNSSRFQSAIRLGWTSYCGARSATVRSPHTASKTTLALKAALCLRLDLMLIDLFRCGLLRGHFYGKRSRLGMHCTNPRLMCLQGPEAQTIQT